MLSGLAKGGPDGGGNADDSEKRKNGPADRTETGAAEELRSFLLRQKG